MATSKVKDIGRFCYEYHNKVS